MRGQPAKLWDPNAPCRVLAWTPCGGEGGLGCFRGPDLEAEAEERVRSQATGWQRAELSHLDHLFPGSLRSWGLCCLPPRLIIL